MSVFVTAGTFKGLPAVHVGNKNISLRVLTGGGHIACVEAPGVHFNPLWEPHWATTTPALRKLVGTSSKFSQAPADRLESELLSCICGHNLCCDVFGAHSAGEVKSGASFHGEAAMCTWEVIDVVPSVSVTLEAHLRRSGLVVRRTFIPDPEDRPIILVQETLENLLGVERALGRSQHVSIGTAMLEGLDQPCRFSCNADRGMTWPVDEVDTFEPGAEFEYPLIPAKGQPTPTRTLEHAAGGQNVATDASSASEAGQKAVPSKQAVAKPLDWRRFPRNGGAPNSDLLTLRIRPEEKHGWFVAERTLVNEKASVALGYRWERTAFPWLMTWEENMSRQQAPWSGRTLVRGLEFGSYAFATSRRDNVTRGTLFDQPCFEWLDAKEHKNTQFLITLQRLESDAEAGDSRTEAISLPNLLDRVGFSEGEGEAPAERR